MTARMAVTFKAVTGMNLKARFGAAGIHLGGSAIVAILAAALVFLLWYPGHYARMAGGVGLFWLITAVDVVIGPLITFAVFDRRKPVKELRRDIAVVVLLQLMALAYGLHTMYIARPVVMALEEDRFRVVAALDVLVEELPQAPAELRGLSLTGPVMVRAAKPSQGEKLDAIQRALTGHDIGARPKFWRQWDDVARQEVRAAAKSLDVLAQRFPSRRHELDEAIRRTGLPRGQLGFIPVISLHADAVALVDRGSGNLVGFAAFDAF